MTRKHSAAYDALHDQLRREVASGSNPNAAEHQAARDAAAREHLKKKHAHRVECFQRHRRGYRAGAMPPGYVSIEQTRADLRIEIDGKTSASKDAQTVPYWNRD